MRFSAIPAFALLTAAGCVSSVPEAPPPGPLEWPAGDFALQATVAYNHSTGTGAQLRATENHTADLLIGSDGSMTIACSSGSYQVEDDALVKNQMRRGIRTFRCGDVSYTVRPAGSTLLGEVRTSVPDVRRERGGCARYDDNGACVEYSYIYRETRRTVTAPLRVTKKGVMEGGSLLTPGTVEGQGGETRKG